MEEIIARYKDVNYKLMKDSARIAFKIHTNCNFKEVKKELHVTAKHIKLFQLLQKLDKIAIFLNYKFDLMDDFALSKISNEIDEFYNFIKEELIIIDRRIKESESTFELYQINLDLMTLLEINECLIDFKNNYFYNIKLDNIYIEYNKNDINQLRKNYMLKKSN